MRSRTLVSLLAAVALPAAAQTPGFQPGEQIDLVVDFLHLRAGQARIVVGSPEGSVWPLIFQARTGGVAGILDIREHLVSYWDAQDRLSRGSDLAAVELGDRHQDSARFDRVNGKATVRVTRKGRRTERTHDIPPGVQDLQSALMWLRLQDLAPGSHHEVPVFTGSRTFTLVADALGHEAVDTPAGRFETVKVQVRTAFQGKFSTKRDSFFWLSADPRHIPVRISVDFAVGSVVAALSGYRPGGALASAAALPVESAR